jgi:phosphate starvation-inducible PhoH-like protein
MKKKDAKKEIVVANTSHIPELFGINDEHLRFIEDKFSVRITTRGNHISITGDDDHVYRVERLLTQLESLIAEGFSLKSGDLRFVIRLFLDDRDADLREIFSERIQVYTERRFITPKSISQKEYIYAIEKYDLVFGIGPAGTGKTYLAMAMAISGLMKKRVSRIILTRPAVEAGEKLGFLPGDLYEKINPYLRPLYDALYDMMDFEKAQKLVERGLIEIAPLAYMRGRTLNDSFIILDEAQNATSEQMKMFLTRLGFNSKAVITGDVTQVDLPHEKGSGLIEVQDILDEVEGIRFVYFSERDVIRHDLVQSIIKAYEKNKNLISHRPAQTKEKKE